jgi:hypothetical protein
MRQGKVIYVSWFSRYKYKLCTLVSWTLLYFSC